MTPRLVFVSLAGLGLALSCCVQPAAAAPDREGLAQLVEEPRALSDPEGLETRFVGLIPFLFVGDQLVGIGRVPEESETVFDDPWVAGAEFVAELPGLDELSPGTSIRGGLSTRWSGPEGGLQGSASAEVSVALDESLAPGLEESVTLTVSGSLGTGLGGSARIGAVEVEGSLSAGVQGSYSVTVDEDHYRLITAGLAPLPDPLNPRTMPIGSSAVLLEEDFVGTSLGVSFRQIGITAGLSESEGTAIGVVRVDEDTVQVFAGPTEAVQASVELGFSLGADPFSISAGIFNHHSLRDTRTRFASIDITTPAGEDAYAEFLETGEVPHQDAFCALGDARAVVESGTIETLTESEATSLGVELGIGGFELGVSVNGASADRTQSVTRYTDGRVQVDLGKRLNGASLATRESYDAEGELIPEESFTVLLVNDLGRHPAGWLAQAFGGRDPGFQGDQDVELAFSQEDIHELQDLLWDWIDEHEYWGDEPLSLPFVPGVTVFLDVLLDDSATPLEVANAFVNSNSSEHIAQFFLEAFLDIEQPLPGEVRFAAD